MNPPAYIPVTEDAAGVSRRKRFWKRSIWISLACSVGFFLMGMIGFVGSLQQVFFDTEEAKLVSSKLRPDLTEHEFNIMMTTVYPMTGSILAGIVSAWTVVSVVRFLKLRKQGC